MLNLVLNKPFKQLLIMSSLFITASCSQANDFITDPNYQSFKQKTMNTYGLTSDQIDNAMSGAKNLPNILSIMTRPGESKPWYDYKAMFLAEGTIQRGVRFKNPIC
ncbi:membrane-bound lytic murein transglycosylase B [Acinetobacter baylyi]|nr:membrane-bound lytic murein transglycosylase B [Acinetobacter baylyi]